MSLSTLAVTTAAGTAHSNSTDEAVLASYALPANFLQSGKSIRWQGAVRATSTNSTDTLTVNCRVHTSAAVAGTIVATSGAVDVANNDVVIFDLTLVPRSSAGTASGSILVFGLCSAPGAEGTATARVAFEVLSSIDYTAAQHLIISADWSVASASNSCQAEANVVYELV